MKTQRSVARDNREVDEDRLGKKRNGRREWERGWKEIKGLRNGQRRGNVQARWLRMTEGGDRTKKYKRRESRAGGRKGNKVAKGVKKFQKDITET
jgi:hypothetical protein